MTTGPARRTCTPARPGYSCWPAGTGHHHLGQYQEATDCYRRALDRLHDLGAQFEEAQVRIHLGDTLSAAGDMDAAQVAWRQAWGILENLGHPDAEQLRARLRDVFR